MRELAETASLSEALAAVNRSRTRRSFDALRILAAHASDPRIRILALRALAAGFGERARVTILAQVQDGDEMESVRTEAARLVGSTGSGAAAQLDLLINSDLPQGVRCGAVLGLAQAGTVLCASRALALATDPEHPLRLAASESLGAMIAPEAAQRLVDFVSDETAQASANLTKRVRVALCRSLGLSRLPTARNPLERMLRVDPVPAVREAAARALGILGRREAMDAIAAARNDESAEVARAAQIALTRLSHVRE